MSKENPDIPGELHQRNFQLDRKTEAKLTLLAMVANNIWLPPAIRIEARRRLTKLYQEITPNRTGQTLN
jgi:hypothetical protein